MVKIFELEQHPEYVETLYVSRKLRNSNTLKEWARSQGFDTELMNNDLHVTICYSTVKVNWLLLPPLKNILYNMNSKRNVELFKENVCVLTFESPLLQERWHQFLDIGTSATFIPYKPHVTISYHQNITNVENIEPFYGPLIFGPEIYAKID